MRIDITEVTESGRDRQVGGKETAEDVDKDINLLIVVSGKYCSPSLWDESQL